MISFIPSCEDIHTDEKKKQQQQLWLSQLPRVSVPMNNGARTERWSSGCQKSPSTRPEAVSCQQGPREHPLATERKAGLDQGSEKPREA